MWIFILKTLVAALIISFCSWLSNKRPEISGFIVALPLTTMLVLLFSYSEFQNSDQTVKFAKSIFVGVPISMTFFIPFLLAQKFYIGFAACYTIGIAFIVGGFFIHKMIVS